MQNDPHSTTHHDEDFVPGDGFTPTLNVPADPRNPSRANPDYDMIRMIDGGSVLDVNAHALRTRGKGDFTPLNRD